MKRLKRRDAKTMTRKDYQMIAEVLSRHIAHWDRAKEVMSEDRLKSQAAASAMTVRDIALSFAGELGNTNPRFDRKRFLEACNFTIDWQA